MTIFRIIKRRFWLIVYSLAAILTFVNYWGIRTLFITQEPTVYQNRSNLTVNFILLFAAFGAMCPILSHKLGKPH